MMTIFLINLLLIQRDDPDFFKRWLEEDAVYVITEQELQAAKLLSTPEEKDAFIKQFWERRDPTPGTIVNEYREEHYRRIAYANEKYTAGTAGWRTDRGKMYIRFGAPDNIEASESAGSTVMRSGNRRMTVPFEIWEYRNIPGIGLVKMTFVDRTMSGYYELTVNPEDKIARFSNEDPLNYRNQPNEITTPGETADSLSFAKRLAQYIAIQRPPEIKFKDLKEAVSVRLSFNNLNFDLRSDVILGGSSKSIVPITYQFSTSTLAFEETSDGQRAQVNVYGVITNLSGQVVYEFEDAATLFAAPYFQRIVALDPGRYKLATVVKDVGGGNMGTKELLIVVPRSQSRLETSSLILADILVSVPASETPLDNFVLSSYRVRPLVKSEISKSSLLGLYLEIYNFRTDPSTGQPDIEARLQLFQKGGGTHLLDIPISTEEMSIRYGNRILIAKNLDTRQFSEGEYVVRLRISDKIANEVTLAEAPLRLKSP
ncbi:MAG: GWxTD domain-containing protein [Acidobacteria bacterium]|nr:GWxTD domain-containing protein [Acidobacteriota bacterium]